MSFMKRMLLSGFLLAAATAFTGASAQAQEFGQDRGIVGTWYFFVTISGAPPCQCIQVATISADGTIAGPPNDNLSGEQRGVWARGNDGRYNFTVLQNNINQDGTAGGLFIIKFTMDLAGKDAASGKSTFQLLSNGGTPIANGTATFTATRIRP